MTFFNPTVAWLTWRQLFANKRLYFAIAFSLTPLLIAVAFRTFVSDPTPDVTVGFYRVLGLLIILGVILPLAAVVFGTTAFAGEIDDGTLVYLLVKPVPRWTIVLTKYVVAVACTVALMVPAIYLPWLAIRVPELPAATPAAFLTGAAAGAALYCALFLLIGVVSRKAIVIGLLYIVAFEEVLSRSVPGVRSLSIREFSTSIAQKTADVSLQLGTASLSNATLRNVTIALLIGAVGFTIWKLRRYEVAERL